MKKCHWMCSRYHISTYFFFWPPLFRSRPSSFPSFGKYFFRIYQYIYLGSISRPFSAKSIQQKKFRLCIMMIWIYIWHIFLITFWAPYPTLLVCPSRHMRNRHTYSQMTDCTYSITFRELNELVHSHHKQLITWEMDRQRVSMIMIYYNEYFLV